MNLPKDWSKKPDWLDRASEPSPLTFMDRLSFVWGALLIIGSLVCFALFFGRLIF